MRAADFFPNVYQCSANKGYFFRICSLHIKYFAGWDNKTLRKTLKMRNEFYFENSFLPRGYFLVEQRTIVKCENSKTGINGIGLVVCNKRAGNPYLIDAKLRNLKTRAYTHKHFPVSKLAFMSSDSLKKAKIIKTTNANQYNLIVYEYNRLLFERLYPIAKREARTLEPELFKHRGVDMDLWKRAFNTIFPKGLKFNYLAKE